MRAQKPESQKVCLNRGGGSSLIALTEIYAYVCQNGDDASDIPTSAKPRNSESRQILPSTLTARISFSSVV